MESSASRDVRRTVLRRIVMQHEISSQAELIHHLRREGIRATQATVSRDLAALSAHKAYTPDGRVVYVVPGEGADAALVMPSDTKASSEQLHDVMRKLVLKLARSDNLIVLTTPPGAAQYLASQIDHLHLDDILGTIAGDDTILLIARNTDTAARVERRFSSL